jgi:hypothetical protein
VPCFSTLVSQEENSSASNCTGGVADTGDVAEKTGLSTTTDSWDPLPGTMSIDNSESGTFALEFSVLDVV